MDTIYCSGYRRQHYFPLEGNPLFCLTFFLLPWSFGCTTTQNEGVKTQRMGGWEDADSGWMCQKVPIIVISSYKETEQNTCPSPEADAGPAFLSLGPLHSKETFWLWFRLSSMKHKGLLVLRLTHPHKQLDKPAPTFSKGQSVFIHPKHTKKSR